MAEPHVIPESMGIYRVVGELYENQTYLASSEGGRQVVLKILDADCLLKNQLYSSVRDRLARVRELPLVGVANLLGVQRDGQRTFMVWEYVKGVSLDQWTPTPGQLERIARELIVQVRALHSRGIVHGALHGRNVFITPSGRLRLTHVSPYLYHEESDDAGPLIELLRGLAARCGGGAAAFARLVDQAAGQSSPIASLSASLAALIETDDTGAAAFPRERGDRLRRRLTLAMAAGVAVAALALYHELRQMIH